MDVDPIKSIDDGPHTKRCSGREDCWGECWDAEEWPTPDDLRPEDYDDHTGQMDADVV